MIEIKIKGRTIPVHVTSGGEFSATVEGENLLTDTLAKLKAQATTILGRKPLNIRFVQFEQRNYRNDKSTLRYGTVLSVHSGNGNLIVRFDGNASEAKQFTSYDAASSLLREDTDTDELMKLWKAKEEAEAAFEKFRRDHKLEVKP